MTIAGVMVAAIVIIADGFLRGMFYAGRGTRRSSGRGGGQAAALLLLLALLLAILAPILARILYLACSRRREYLADACAARFTRYPEGLASALEKISSQASRMADVNRATAPMYIVNPLKGSSSAHSLFSTHPPTSERVRILRSMGGAAGYAAYEAAYAKASGRHLLGKETLSDADVAGVRAPSAEPEPDDLAKARDVVDILHRMDGLLFLACACGLKIKIPRGHKGDKVQCPACARVIGIPAPMLVAAGALTMAEAAEKDGERPEATDPERKPGREQALAYRFQPGRWQSFRCSCGYSVQLSPSFGGNRVRCDRCRRTIQIQRA